MSCPSGWDERCGALSTRSVVTTRYTETDVTSAPVSALERESAMKSRSRGLIKLLALVSVFALVLAACGNGEEAEPESPAAPEAPAPSEEAAEEPEEEAVGGILNVAVLNDVQAWDASRLQGIFFPQHQNIYESLAVYENGLNAEPWLATGWVINDAQDSVTITLREGVLFHSGREMKAEDVSANIAQMMNSETGNQAFGPTSGAVADWEVTGDYELVVNFQAPLSELQITDLLTSWNIADPEFFDVFDREGNGTGPFRLVEWNPGESIIMEAFDGYWGEGPFLDGIEYRIFGDQDAMDSAFESGVVDLIFLPRTDSAVRFIDAGGVIVEAPAGAIIDQWRINPDRPPFDNYDVRLAMNYASDNDALNAAIYGGLGTTLRLPYAPTSPAYDQALADSLEFDLDRARELLENSGVPESEWTANVLISSGNATQELSAQIMQQSLAQIGFTLEIEVVDAAERTERLLGGGFDILYGGIGNAQKFPTRITTNSIYRASGNPIFDIEATFPDYVAAIAAANASVTPDEQAAAFAELNRSLVDNMWVVTVMASPRFIIQHPHVSGTFLDIDAQMHNRLTRVSR